VSVIHLLITQYTYRFYTKLKTTKKKTIKYSKLYIMVILKSARDSQRPPEAAQEQSGTARDHPEQHGNSLGTGNNAWRIGILSKYNVDLLTTT
jgi:hypothetical protein